MSDTYRRYGAIKRAIMQFYQPRPTGQRVKHLNTLVALKSLSFSVSIDSGLVPPGRRRRSETCAFTECHQSSEAPTYQSASDNTAAV